MTPGHHAKYKGESINNLKLLHLYSREQELPFHLSTELSKMDCICSSDQRKYTRRIARLNDLFVSISSDLIHHLLLFWLDNVLTSKVAESILTSCNVIIADDLLPKSVTVIRNAASLAEKYVRVSSNFQRRSELMD